MEKVEVSVIIPVYKVEQYLKQCLDSLINQTYSSFEIILIDDGSPDKSGKICDSYAKRFDFIKVFHTPNNGLADARNLGLRNAIGDYILFVDSDDWLSNDYIDMMVKIMKKYHGDMVISEFYHVYNNGRIQKYYDSEVAVEVLNRKDYFQKLLEENEITNHVWRRLYKRNLINKDPFPIGKNYEDIMCMFNLSKKCTTFINISYAGYFYRDNENSIVNTATIKNCFDYLKAVELESKEIIAVEPGLSAIAQSNLVLRYLDGISKIQNSNKISADMKRKAIDIILKKVKEIPINFKLLKLSNQEKIKYFLKLKFSKIIDRIKINKNDKKGI